MNDKLKQSLQGRLSGMRWGEREQAEVFRQIQQKEMQEVKHVKRGTSMLALAAAMLFFIMGAAFVMSGTGQPEDTTVLAQPTENNFIPVPAAHCENDYAAITIDNPVWEFKQVSFDVTIRLKEPDKYGLIIGSYANPGSEGRTMLTTGLTARCDVSCGGKYYESAVVQQCEVLSMSTDSATVRMTYSELPPAADLLNIVLTVEAKSSQPVFSAEAAFALQRDAEAVAQSMRNIKWAFENDLVTAYLTETINIGEQVRVTIDILPKKPWYVINTTEPGKSTLTVSAEWSVGYDDETPLKAITPTDPEVIPTSEGARAVTLLPFPSEHRTASCIIHFTVQDTQSGADFDNYIRMELTQPDPNATAALTPAATPSPTPAPLVRSEPRGKHIGGTEQVSVYLEDSWFDGFSAEGTLRIRADDADVCRLALTPNANGAPSASTWVLQLDDGESEYQNDFDYTMSIEEATGDVIVQFTYCDLHAHGSSNPQNPRYDDFSLYYDLALTLTNELTWVTEADDLTLEIAPSGEYPCQPLRLVSADDAGLFKQAGIITTDRYHYVGIMLTSSNQGLPKCYLLDERGRLLGTSDHYMGVTGNSLLIFPRRLFPYNGDADSQYYLLVARIDKSVQLPETLRARITGRIDTEVNLATFELVAEPAPTPTPTPAPVVTHETTGEHIGGTEHLSVYLMNYWYDGYSAEGTLRIRADDPAASHLVLSDDAKRESGKTTWLVQLDDGEPIYQNDFDLSMMLEKATGDVIVDFVFYDSFSPSSFTAESSESGVSRLSQTITLTAVNLQSQLSETEEFKLELAPSGEHTYQPLYLVSTTADDVLAQAGLTTTDRYHYISFMMHARTVSYPRYTMTDAEGYLLGTTAGYYRTSGHSLISSPRGLFPYEGDALAEYLLHVIRIDKSKPLPDTLHVRLYDNTEIASFVLTADAESAPAPLARSQPTGEHIGGTKHLSVYLEDYWFDGYSAEGMLRIRSDDAEVCQLALEPNANGIPHASTWVVQLDDGEDYFNDFDYIMSVEEATGDILVTFTYCNLFADGWHTPQSSVRDDPNLYYDITVTAINELTWDTEIDQMTLELAPSGDSRYQPLYLVSTTADDAFGQAGMVTTDHYRYIGVMASPGYKTNLHFNLMDENGTLLAASVRYHGIHSETLMLFPMMLFPFNENTDAHHYVSVVRIDKSLALPDPLHVQLLQGTTTLADITLSTTAPAVDSLQSVTIVQDSNMLFDNEPLTASMPGAGLEDGHAAVHLLAQLKEPDEYTFLADDPNESRQLLSMSIDFDA